MESVSSAVAKSYYLYMILELIVFMLPIAGLIWKAAKQAGKLENMASDISELKKRIEDNEKQSVKDMTEIRESIAAIDKRNVEIFTSIQFIKDYIAELKASKGK